jgi:hypothetical protein
MPGAQKFLSRGKGLHPEVGHFQQALQGPPHVRVIVHDKNDVGWGLIGVILIIGYSLLPVAKARLLHTFPEMGRCCQNPGDPSSQDLNML